ncbi:MAG: hypothetical protein AABO41_01900 [Acidobacteriota bacterium]
MTPIYCQECSRANGASAKRCIWCGVPIVDRGAPEEFAATKIEIDYLDGIERLDGAATVRLVINRDGIEVSETVPGSRTFKIPAASIIEANVVDGSTVTEGKRIRSGWWWLALGPFAVFVPGKKTPDTKNHDYLLTIKYKQGSETRTAVFHREDRAGLPVVEGLARIVSALVRLRDEVSKR